MEESSRQWDVSISAGKLGWHTSLGPPGLGVLFFEKQKDIAVPPYLPFGSMVSVSELITVHKQMILLLTYHL